MNKTLYLTSVLETKGARKNNKPLKIAGYANTADKDRAGDIIPATAWQKALKIIEKIPYYYINMTTVSPLVVWIRLPSIKKVFM